MHARGRRCWLAALAGAVLGLPLGQGCAAPFNPPSQVSSLRVFAVVATERDENGAVIADKSYAKAEDEVTFEMTYADAFGEEPRLVQILWLGGCFNPEGDAYYLCYEQLANVLEGIDPENPIASGFVGFGDLFTMTIPKKEEILDRPAPVGGARYGIAYVFFAACAGTIAVVPPEGTGRAGSFPLGCFDADGKRLGAESFVPGYTQIYVYDDDPNDPNDGRENANPAVSGIALGETDRPRTPLPEDFAAIPSVAPCAVTAEERRVQGCGAEDPYASCTTYDLEVLVGEGVADVDPSATAKDGSSLKEAVWVDYYIDRGDLDSDVKLVSDPIEGLITDNPVRWIAPAETGLATLWAVVHDARGGATVVKRFIRVE